MIRFIRCSYVGRQFLCGFSFWAILIMFDVWCVWIKQFIAKFFSKIIPLPKNIQSHHFGKGRESKWKRGSRYCWLENESFLSISKLNELRPSCFWETEREIVERLDHISSFNPVLSVQSPFRKIYTIFTHTHTHTTHISISLIRQDVYNDIFFIRSTPHPFDSQI